MIRRLIGGQGRAQRTLAYTSGRQAYLFILPGFVIYALFVLVPVARTFGYSFYRWSGFGAPEFIGLENYIKLLGDSDFWLALQHNAFFVIFYTIVPIMLGLFLTALLTRRRLRGLIVFRVGLFLPQVMSPVVVGIIWRWLFAYDGPINNFLAGAGLKGMVRPWLGDFFWAPYAVGAVGTWVEYGLCLVLFVAGVQSISHDLYDSAAVCGANAWQQFRFVTLPGLRQQVLVAFILTFIAALRVFDLVFVLTRGGGPGKQTLVVSLLIYEEAFKFHRAGYASAISVALTVIILLVSVVVIRLQSAGNGEG